MDLSANPDELDQLFSLITGKGAAASPQEDKPPESAQNNPSGPISANTQNPIPNNASFAANVSGQPQPQEQVQVPSPSPAAQAGAMPGPPTNAASQPVAVSTPGGQGVAMKLFTDPTALMLMGAALGSRSNNESLLQAASRGLLSGMQYMNLSDRQKYMDQMAEQEAAQKGAESAARTESSYATAAANRAQAEQTGVTTDTKRKLQETEIATAKQRLEGLKIQYDNAKTQGERDKIAQQMDQINLGLKQKYGESLAGLQVAEAGANVSSKIRQNEKTDLETQQLKAKLDAFNSLSPEDKQRVALGGTARGLKTREDRLYDFYPKVVKQFTDPNTGLVDQDGLMKAFIATEKYLGKDTGEDWKIPEGAVAKLKANPGMKAAFDSKYGAGAADRVLGQKKE